MNRDNNFFVYNGKGYLPNTSIKLKQEYVDTHLYNGQKIWPYAYFNTKSQRKNGEDYYMFSRGTSFGTYNVEWQKSAGYFVISYSDLQNAIEEIVKPREIEIVPKTKRKDLESNEVMVGWLIYVAALFASLIFREWYMIWFVGSMYFFAWRDHKLWED